MRGDAATTPTPSSTSPYTVNAPTFTHPARRLALSASSAGTSSNTTSAGANHSASDRTMTAARTTSAITTPTSPTPASDVALAPELPTANADSIVPLTTSRMIGQHHDEAARQVERADERERLQPRRLEAVEQVADFEWLSLAQRPAPEHQPAGVNRHDDAPEHARKRNDREHHTHHQEQDA